MGMDEDRPVDSRPYPRPRLVAGPSRLLRELPRTERPRERLASHGAGGLSAAELIGLLWGSGSRGRSAIDLATDALARHDGLPAWHARATPSSSRSRAWA